MRKIIREPLLHFMLLGAAFFLLYALVGQGETDRDVISIDESDLDEVVAKFEMQWKRPPTEEELISILEKRVEQEIFYQEALKMNLDHNDEIIKRRLAQKMQFLSNDISSLLEPTDEELRSYYLAHQERYIQDAIYSLHQIYFSPDIRDNWLRDAKQTLTEINSLTVEEAKKKGDPISLPGYFENTTSFHINRQMGDEFTSALEDLEVGKWQGPVRSGYGDHLVLIERMEVAKPAPFEAVKGKVMDDFNFEKQKAVKASIYKEFEKDYEIQFDVQSELYSEELVEKLKTEIIGS